MNETLTVLFLDDDVDFRDNRIALLEALFPGRLTFVPTKTRDESLAALDRGGIDLAIVDIYMRNLKPGGIDVARQASRMGVTTIIYSGKRAADYRAAVQADHPGPVTYVQKGGDINDLRPHVEERLARHDALRASLAHAAQDELVAHHFGWRRGTVVAVRFHVGDVTAADLRAFRDGTTAREVEQTWRLTHALNVWLRTVRHHGGDPLSIGGRVVVVWFPTDGKTTGMKRAMAALRDLADASAADVERVWHAIHCSAGVVPGRVTTGVFGDRFPSTPAVVSPLFDIAVALANTAGRMAAATLDDWLTPAEADVFAALGTELESINLAMPEPATGWLLVVRRRLA